MPCPRNLIIKKNRTNRIFSPSSLFLFLETHSIFLKFSQTLAWPDFGATLRFSALGSQPFFLLSVDSLVVLCPGWPLVFCLLPPFRSVSVLRPVRVYHGVISTGGVRGCTLESGLRGLVADGCREAVMPDLGLDSRLHWLPHEQQPQQAGAFGVYLRRRFAGDDCRTRRQCCRWSLAGRDQGRTRTAPTAGALHRGP